MHTIRLQTVHNLNNACMFWRQSAILRESEIQRNTSTDTSFWEVQCQILRYLKILKLWIKIVSIELAALLTLCLS
jgi:hypothetical protein